jgi:hypothetical protein
MKTAFDFHSRLAVSRENLTRPAALSAHFLPGSRAKTPGPGGSFTAGLTHLPQFAGVFNFYSETTTMAQPLLKGELR